MSELLTVLPGGMKYVPQFDEEQFVVGYPIEVQFNSGDTGYHHFGLIKKVEQLRIMYTRVTPNGDNSTEHLYMEEFKNPDRMIKWIRPDREGTFSNHQDGETT